MSSKKVTFIGEGDFKLYVNHPGKVDIIKKTIKDENGNDRIVEEKNTIWEPKLMKCHFINSVFMTDDPQLIDGIENHPHFGRRFWRKPESVGEVENKYQPEKQTLANALAGMTINVLRGIAKERSLTDWDRLKSMQKEQLVEFMVEHKDRLGHYATLGH